LSNNYKTKVAVVILNWNGRKFLEDFLPSVVANSIGAEVIVADNDSSDDSVEFMREHYPDIRLIINAENTGYAQGYNNALAEIDAEYFVLLNSDIEVGENWVMPIIEEMDKDKNIAAAQPKLRAFFPEQRHEFEYAGAAGGFIDKYGYPFCRGRIFDNLETDKGQYDENMEIFWASGAAMFVRADAFREVGGLDGDFFAHMEEIDFCWRLKLEGYKIMSIPKSTVYHVGGGTLPKNSARKTYLNFRNNFTLLVKNLPRNRVVKVILYRLILDGVAGLKFLSQGHYKDTIAIIKAHFYFYTHLGEIKAKRKGRKLTPVTRMYNRNIVFDHYIKRKTKFSELKKELFTK